MFHWHQPDAYAGKVMIGMKMVKPGTGWTSPLLGASVKHSDSLQSRKN
jgi:hypothetical protein